jgi:MerR family transcriptional regulator, light-induced transcriptional regulator
MSLSKNPVYNLKAVLKETGLKADVLRAWERRYGLPVPERTQGGHRLYSDFDVAMLKWLMMRQGEGLSISRAAEMWKEHILQGRNPVEEMSAPPKASLQVVSRDMALPTSAIDAMREQWLNASLNFNEIEAEQTLNQAFALYPVETVCMDVLQRGMAEIGNLWYGNRASVQQEHFASALAMRRLDALLAASPAPTRAQTVLIGCPSEEWHTFTPLLLTLFLRRRGLNVIYLGANVPVNRFEETIKMVKADLTILVVQQLTSAAELQYAAQFIAISGAQVAFGGRIFSIQPGMETRITGHYLGDRLNSAVTRVESLLAGKPDSAKPVLPSSGYVATLNSFIAKRSLIESTIDAEARTNGFDPTYFNIAHKFMGDNIIACLRLGEISYLDSEIDWLITLLKGFNLPESVVPGYLRLYSAAVYHHLDGDARPITDWLDTH